MDQVQTIERDDVVALATELAQLQRESVADALFALTDIEPALVR